MIRVVELPAFWMNGIARFEVKLLSPPELAPTTIGVRAPSEVSRWSLTM